MRHHASLVLVLLLIAIAVPLVTATPAHAACFGSDDVSSGSEPVSARCKRVAEELDAEGELGAEVNRVRRAGSRSSLEGWTDLLVASRWWAEQPEARDGVDPDLGVHVGHQVEVASLSAAVEVPSAEPSRAQLAAAVDEAVAGWRAASADRAVLLDRAWDHIGLGAELQFWTDDESCSPGCSGRYELVLVATFRAADGRPPSPWSAHAVDGGRPPNTLDDAARFVDVPADHTFHRAIDRLADADVTRGCNEAQTRFCPGSVVTRGQMAAFLVRALDLPPGDRTFVDVPAGHTFRRDIASLASQGITRGCNPSGGNTRFCPDAPVTRGQMAAFLGRALELRAGSARFEDVSTGHTFRGDIAALASAGITKGCNPSGGNTRFCPDDPVTRGQMAAFLARSGVLDPGGNA